MSTLQRKKGRQDKKCCWAWWPTVRAMIWTVLLKPCPGNIMRSLKTGEEGQKKGKGEKEQMSSFGFTYQNQSTNSAFQKSGERLLRCKVKVTDF